MISTVQVNSLHTNTLWLTQTMLSIRLFYADYSTLILTVPPVFLADVPFALAIKTPGNSLVVSGVIDLAE